MPRLLLIREIKHFGKFLSGRSWYIEFVWCIYCKAISINYFSTCYVSLLFTKSNGSSEDPKSGDVGVRKCNNVGQFPDDGREHFSKRENMQPKKSNKEILL